MSPNPASPTTAIGTTAPRGTLLIVTDRRFWRRSIGSEQRIAALVRHLVQRGERVAVAYLGRLDRRERQRLDVFLNDCPGLQVDARSFSLMRWLGEFARRFMAAPRRDRERREDGAARPLSDPLAPHSAARRTFVVRQIRMRRPRIVLVEFLRLAYTVSPRPPGGDAATHYLIDTHDVMHQRAQRYRAEGARVAREMDRDQEVRALDAFDTILAIQDAEGRLLSELLPDKTVLVVPHGLDIPSLAARPRAVPRHGEPVRLGFLGGRDEANLRALDWFVDEVWPTLQQRVGARAELLVAGQISRVWSREPTGVRVLGPIDSIDDFWPRIHIAVNPVRFGSGLKIKNVEALAYACALLTTRIGAEGLEAASPDGMRIAESAPDWIRQLQAWIDDPNALHEIASAGRAYAERRLSEQAAFAGLGAHLDRVLGAPPNPPEKEVAVESDSRS